MKKTLIAAAVALIMVACNNQQGGNFKVTATMPDETTDGQTAYITNYDTGDTVAQAVIKDKVVVLEGKVDTTYMARLIVADNRMEFVVEPAEIAINLQEQKVTGGKLNEAFAAIDADLGAISQEGGDNPEAMMAAEKKLIDRFYRAYEDNRDNGIGPWAFNYYLMYNDFNAQQLDSIINAAPERYRNLKRVKKAVAAANALVTTAVGQQFVDFTDAKGTKLSDFAGKGKYTLVDFWASWCGPCKREIPNIKGLYDKYKSKMNFVGVAVWDKPDDTNKAIKDLQIPWPVMQGEPNWTEPTDLYGINGIPHIMLIDPDGKIVARQLGGDLLVKTITDLNL